MNRGDDMAKSKLNYRFHNPNTPEETVKYISKIFMDVCRNKFEQRIKETSNSRVAVTTLPQKDKLKKEG